MLSAYLLPAAAPCNCSVHSHFLLQTCRWHAPGTPVLPVAGRPQWCNTPGSALAGLARGLGETASCPPTGNMSGVYCWRGNVMQGELTSRLLKATCRIPPLSPRTTPAFLWDPLVFCTWRSGAGRRPAWSSEQHKEAARRSRASPRRSTEWWHGETRRSCRPCLEIQYCLHTHTGSNNKASQTGSRDREHQIKTPFFAVHKTSLLMQMVWTVTWC